MGELDKILGLWKTFHLILMHFFIILQCFEERLLKILLIFKNSFFLQFWSIEFVFRLIKIAFKNFSKSLPGSIDQTWFRSIEHRESSFFLTQCLTHSKHFFKLSSLSPTWQGSTEDFLSFSTKFFARFFSPKAGKTFLPLLLFLFSCFHA